MNRIKAAVLLLTTTFFWGITFTVVKQAIETVDVFVFLAQRFILAFVLILPICIWKGKRLDLKTVKNGSVMGLVLFGAFAFQTVALLYTTASNTGFLTGMNVVIVPVLASFLFRHRITSAVKVAIILATAGLFLLCGNGSLNFNMGDVLAIICAVCISLHLIFTGEFVRNCDFYWLTAVQLGIVALFSIIGAVYNGQQVLVWHPHLLWPLLVCSLIATVFAFLVQTSMQRFISHTKTALIFCTEPVFAAIYAWLVLDEKLGYYGLLGAVLILAGMLISIMPDKSSESTAAILEEHRAGE
jgi:drug/metabolite transporter (DMT)-like permease